MNENPEGMPNPLNPNPVPGVQPDSTEAPVVEPAPAVETPVAETAPVAVTEIVTEEIVAEPVAEPMATNPVVSAAPVADPIVETMTATEAVTEPTMTAEPVAADSIIEPKGGKKKKTGLIIAILAILVAIGCAVAALLILNPFAKADPVATAISKILKGETPKNIGLDGEIMITSDMEESDVTELKLTFNTQRATTYGTGKTSASLGMALVDGSEFTLNFEEATVDGGDIYLKISDVEVVESEEEVLDCAEVADGTDCIEIDSDGVVDPTMSAIETIIMMLDGQWIRISSEFLGGEDMLLSLTGDTQCVVDLVNGFSNNGNTIVEYYNQNLFISSTTEGVSVSSKHDTLYKVNLDAEKLQGFANNLTNISSFKDFLNCVGAPDEAVTLQEVKDLIADLPVMYAEVNSDNNFSRVYIDVTDEETGTAGVIDLSISYPATIEVTEPADYIDLEEFVMTLMGTSSYPMEEGPNNA